MFNCDMLRELVGFWEKNNVPKSQQCLNPEASAQRQRYYYVFEGNTTNTTESETLTAMAKRMEVTASDLPAASSMAAGDSLEVTMTEASAPQMSALQATRLARSRGKA
eukprot:2856623-Amphidinium_carterae.1